MSAGKIIPWKFLSDEAVDSTDRDSFGTHSTYAKLLLEIARTAATPFSIALYSSWGTGKTSVAKMLQSLAAKEKGIAVVYLDVWKYSSDPLKRWILLETSRQLEKQEILNAYKYQDRTLQSHLEFEEQVEDENKVAVDYKLLTRFVVIIVAFLAILVLASLYLPGSLKSNGALNGLIAVLVSAGLTSVALVSISIEFLKSVSGLVFRRTIRQVIAKPAFSSEKFGEIFQHLVKTATSKSVARILFVFDNLDRCSEDVAVEAIGVIKKRNVLSKLAGLFSPHFDATESRRALWELVLEHQEQLTTTQKAKVAASIGERYSGSKEKGKEEALRLLGITLARPKDFYWCVGNSLLSEIISDTEFSGEPPDNTRVDTLVAYQARMNETARGQLALKMSLGYEQSEVYDEAAERVTAALEKFEPSIFSPPELEPLGKVLLTQVTRSKVGLKPSWLRPMIHIYSALSVSQRSSTDAFLAELIGAPTEPNALLGFLTSMEYPLSHWLLSVAAVREALRSQGTYLEKWGKSQSQTQRKEYLLHFDASGLLDTPEVFDESKVSDLELYVETVQRAAAAEGAKLEDLRRKLLSFCGRYVVDLEPDNSEVYDAVSATVTSDLRLLDAQVAAALARAAMGLMISGDGKESEVEGYYKDFRVWKKELSDEAQGSLLREVAIAFLHDRKDHWLRILQLLAEDVSHSEFQRKDGKLVKDLFDYAFGAAEEEPDEGAEPLLRLLPHLTSEYATEYLDRGLDTLITYEADRKPPERMEPFLKMIENSGARLTSADLGKVVKFCKRMLGPSNNAEEHARALGFIANLKRGELTDALRGELERLAASEDKEAAELAKKLLG